MIKKGKSVQKNLVCFVACLFLVSPLFPCTTFVIGDSTNLIFGRNFDWDISSGMIVINKKGLQKQAFVQPPNFPFKWISKYGSITFNQIGIDAPMGGMNEKGLVIANLGLFESEFPELVGEKVVGELEWIQFQLDNSSNLQEVIENSKNVQIVPVAVPCHYMICDSQGNIGIIEYIKGELVIKTGDDITIPVCSNMIYEDFKNEIMAYEPFGGTKKIPNTMDNTPNIVLACSMIDEYNGTQSIIDYGFNVLQTAGSSARTQWSIIYDMNNKTINFKTISNKSTRTIALIDFDFNCSNEIQFLNMHANHSIPNLNGQFISLTSDYYLDYKRKLLDLYSSQMQGFPKIPDEVVNMEVDYAIYNRKCR